MAAFGSHKTNEGVERGLTSGGADYNGAPPILGSHTNLACTRNTLAPGPQSRVAPELQPVEARKLVAVPSQPASVG
jgi:hypothetical protein